MCTILETKLADYSYEESYLHKQIQELSYIYQNFWQTKVADACWPYKPLSVTLEYDPDSRYNKYFFGNTQEDMYIIYGDIVEIYKYLYCAGTDDYPFHVTRAGGAFMLRMTLYRDFPVDKFRSVLQSRISSLQRKLRKLRPKSNTLDCQSGMLEDCAMTCTTACSAVAYVSSYPLYLAVHIGGTTVSYPLLPVALAGTGILAVRKIYKCFCGSPLDNQAGALEDSEPEIQSSDAQTEH